MNVLTRYCIFTSENMLMVMWPYQINHLVYRKRVVIIFFAANARAASGTQFFTAAQSFGNQLHTYTIVDAINDKGVWDIDWEKAHMAPKRIEWYPGLEAGVPELRRSRP